MRPTTLSSLPAAAVARAAVLLVVLGLATGCARLPEYAAPKGRVLRSSAPPAGDLITYRPLSRADFLGSEPPPEFAPHRERIGAATCTLIATEPGLQLSITSSSDGRSYRAGVVGLGFRALMDRSCSWWNEAPTDVPEEHTLQHEQIHFALYEIEARRLNARADELARGLTATADSPQSAAARVQEMLEALLQERLDATLKENRRFDEATSLGYEPVVQQRWYERVQGELSARTAR